MAWNPLTLLLARSPLLSIRCIAVTSLPCSELRGREAAGQHCKGVRVQHRSWVLKYHEKPEPLFWCCRAHWKEIY